MDKSKLENFIASLSDFHSWSKPKQVDYLAYYLHTEEDMNTIEVRDIRECIDLLSLRKYGRLAAYISENASNSKNGKYIKKGKGYHLERGVLTEIQREVENEPIKVAVDEKLLEILRQVGETDERAYLTEAVNCYRVGACRAAILLTWIVCVERIRTYVFGQSLDEFNQALKKNPYKKYDKVVKYEDFSDLPDWKFVEICRSASILTNDQRKLLDEKLGIRNSAAHPSSITFSEHKTTTFIIDIIQNVLLKF